MIDTLTKQGQDIKKELVQLQDSFNVKKEQLIRIEGALEALEALEQEEPPTPSAPDHTEAAKALGVFK